MKQKFEMKLDFEIIAICEEAMTFAEAEVFAKEVGGRLPSSVEMMAIWDNVTYRECPELAKGVWVAPAHRYFGGKEEVGYAYPNTVGWLMPDQFHTCGAVVVKDAEG